MTTRTKRAAPPKRGRPSNVELAARGERALRELERLVDQAADAFIAIPRAELLNDEQIDDLLELHDKLIDLGRALYMHATERSRQLAVLHAAQRRDRAAVAAPAKRSAIVFAKPPRRRR